MIEFPFLYSTTNQRKNLLFCKLKDSNKFLKKKKKKMLLNEPVNWNGELEDTRTLQTVLELKHARFTVLIIDSFSMGTPSWVEDLRRRFDCRRLIL